MIRRVSLVDHRAQKRVGPRWAWWSWAAMLAALLIGLALWIIHLANAGVPGPVIAGVYIAGPVDVAVLAVYMLAAMVLATIATSMISRVASNLIGWILWGMALWMAFTYLVIMIAYFFHQPGDFGWEFANWLGTWTFVFTVPSSLVLLIFPDGKFLSPAWRILGVMALLGTAGWALTEATGPGLGLQEELVNPFFNPSLLALGDLVSLLLLPALIGTVVSLIMRFRRASLDERLQIKWVALGGILQVGVIMLTWLTDALMSADFPVGVVLIGTISTLFVPLALSMAILRYRLYAIDHLVSRTASYALLGSLLAGGFVLGVIGTQSLFGFSSSLSVAATTITLWALLNPARRRVQTMMDRRFNRSRFDAEMVATNFASRANEVVAPDALLADLETTLRETLAPASLGIWIRH